MQLDPHALRLTAPQCERGVADAHHEGITTWTRLGEDLDLLAVHEAELEESTLEGRQRSRARANAHDRAPRARRQRRKAHEAWHAAHALRAGHSVHEASMNENASHLQSATVRIAIGNKSCFFNQLYANPTRTTPSSGGGGGLAPVLSLQEGGQEAAGPGGSGRRDFLGRA